MATRLPSAPPILPGLAYIRPLGSGGFADVFLYEQDMPRRDVAVKVLPSDVRDPDLRRMFNAEADVLAHLSAHPVDRHRLPGGHLGRRPAVHRHGVLPGVARAALPHRAHPGRRGARRSACGWRARSSPRTARGSSTATSSRATSSSRPSARPVLADFGISSSLHARDRRRGARDVDPVERTRGRRRADRRHGRERGVEPRRDRLLAARRPQPVRAPRARAEHEGAAAPSHRAGELHRHRAHRCPGIPPGGPRARDEPRSARAGTPRRASSPRRCAACRPSSASRRRRSRSPTDEWSRGVGSGRLRRHRAARARRASHVERDERRKTRPDAGVAALARDEDTEFSAPERARAGRCRGSSRGDRRRGRRRRGRRSPTLLRDGRALMRRRTIAGLVAAVAAVALVVGRQRRVARTGRAGDARGRHRRCGRCRPATGRRYARVNTTVGELDTVRSISNPEPGRPEPPTARTSSATATASSRGSTRRCRPTSTRRRCAPRRRRRPARRTSSTAGRLRRLPHRLRRGLRRPARRRARPTQLDPFPSDDEDAPQYTADAIAVDERGMLFSYSRADGSVLRYDIPASEVRGRDPLAADGDRGTVDHGGGRRLGGRRRGRTATSGCGERMPPSRRRRRVRWSSGQPDAGGHGGLSRRRDLARAGARRRLGGRRPRWATAPACSAPPRSRSSHDGEVFAAWLPQGDAGRRAVELERRPVGARLRRARRCGDQRRPTFVASDDAVILNETRSGWVWTVPDGALVASSQNWSLDDRTDPDAVPSEEQLTVVHRPEAAGRRAPTRSACARAAS